MELPKGHKLDSALTNTVRTAVSAACEAMSSLSEDVADAVCAGRKTDDSAKVKLHPVEEISRTRPLCPLSLPLEDLQQKSQYSRELSDRYAIPLQPSGRAGQK